MVVTTLYPLKLSSSPCSPLLLLSFLWEVIQKVGFIPEPVLACEHSPPLKTGTIQLRLSSSSAEASVHQPVYQVAASKHIFQMRLGVSMKLGRA